MLAGVAAGSPMYERAGGEEFFETLTRLELFLIQHFGGPDVYRSERGEARLGWRHRGFSIGPAERDAWLAHMRAAVGEGGLRPLDEAQMLTFFGASANHLVNRP